MPDYADSTIALIDSRIKAALRAGAKMGTVQSRDPSGVRATVSLDGSSGVAQPVKCFTDVIVFPGDRVGLIKFEGDWIIVGNYTLRTLADASTAFQFAATGTTTSTTLTDMPESPTVEFFKVRDDTLLQIDLTFSVRSGTAATRVSGAVHIGLTDGSGTQSDVQIFQKTLDAANLHLDFYGSTRVSGWPSGDYTVTGRWRIASAAGPTLTVDINDTVTINVREVTG